MNTIAVIFPLLFFGIAIIHYVQLGLTTDNNSLRDSPDKAKDYLILNILAVAEIGGFSVLIGLISLEVKSVIFHDGSYRSG